MGHLLVRTHCLPGLGQVARVVVAVLFLLGIAGTAVSSDTGGSAGDTSPAETNGRVTDIAIRIVDTTADHDLWESVARNLIPVKAGDPFSLEVIRKAVTVLTDSGLFSAIHVPDPVPGPGGMALAFELTPFPRIKDIRISGAFPLFEKEVLNAMSIYTGTVYTDAGLLEQVPRIQGLFKGQGYISPQVSVSGEVDRDDGHYTVFVDIDKGAFRRIDQVRVSGNTDLSAGRLKLMTKTWRASILMGSARRFVQKTLDEDVKKLVSAYRARGFADVSVSAQVEEDPGDHSVNVVFRIEEGPWYDVVFQGNDHLSDRKLKKELVLEKEGNKNNFALKKSIRGLKKKYREKGFPDATITDQASGGTSDSGKPATRQIILDIDEGPRYRVSRLTLSGHRRFSEKELMKNILTRDVYVKKVLTDDAAAIKTLYREQGYLSAEVTKEVKIQTPEIPEVPEVRDAPSSAEKSVEIDIRIREGVQTRVEDLEFNGLTTVDRETLLGALALGPGTPFNPALVEADAQRIQQEISEQGYPHTSVTAEEMYTPDKSGVTIRYEISEGTLVRVGEIFYTGNFRTREHILSNEMELETGEPFSLKKLVESRRKIMDIEALDSTRFRTIGLKTGEPEVDVVVAVSEKKPYFFEAGTGYDTHRHFYVNSAVGDRNFTGRNLDLSTRAEVSQIGYDVNVALTEPRLFGSQVMSHSRLFAQEREEFNKTFGITTFGVSQDFFRPFWDKKLRGNLGFAYEYRDQYLTEEVDLTEEEAEQYGTRYTATVSPGLIYNSTDSYVRPRKGVWASANVDISKGIDTELDDFFKYRLEARTYYTPAESLTFALRARYGYIQPYGDNTRVPDDQLFFLGGAATVRGFDENMLRFDSDGQSVGGREMILGSLEARYDLGMNLELSLFFDTGSLRETQGNTESESFRNSVGAGLRYMTPVGPIGLLYGHKLDPEPGESDGEFHFSMGYTF